MYKYNYYSLVLQEENFAKVFGAFHDKIDAQKQVDIFEKQEVHKNKKFLILDKEGVEKRGLILV